MMSGRRYAPSIRGLVYGAAVGDALGVPYEFSERGTFRCTDMVGYGTHDVPAGTWSDDTSLILATVDSINHCMGMVDTIDMRRRFNMWINCGEYAIDGYVFDVGNTTQRALDRGYGLDDEYSLGNGSLMRILPLSLVHGCTYTDIRRVSSITHSNELCVECCAELVEIGRRIIVGMSKMDAIGQRRWYLPCLPSSAISSRGYVEDTLTAALWCFINYDSYEDCVLAAVNLGGDTDTVACIVGGLAGMYYGFYNIPDRWLGILRGKEVIESVLPFTDCE